jgi:uncharacterized protein
MFIKFSVANFKSIRDEQELSMVAYKADDSSDRVISVGRGIGGLVKVTALYGANASGKSNFLQALNFFLGAIRDSQRRWEPTDSIPIQQFALRDDEATPTRMCLDFLLDGVRYQYGFSLSNQTFLGEWLYAFPNARKQVWFERSDPNSVQFGQQLSGPGTGAVNRTIESLMRPNSLLLSVAIQNNYEKLKPIYDHIVRGWVGLLGSASDLATSTALNSIRDQTLKTRLSRLLTAADLGIVDYDVQDEEIEESTKLVIQAMWSAMPETARPDFAEMPSKTSQLRFFHTSKSGKRVSFRSSDESSGTLAYFGLLGPVYTALDKGGFVFIDEIETSLHPNLAREIIGLFTNPKVNRKNAQLLFTTHQAALLTEETLMRDEIWMAEKSEEGASSFFPLTDFYLRRNEKISKGYTQGRFGGVPNVDHYEMESVFRFPDESEGIK